MFPTITSIAVMILFAVLGAINTLEHDWLVAGLCLWFTLCAAFATLLNYEYWKEGR